MTVTKPQKEHKDKDKDKEKEKELLAREKGPTGRELPPNPNISLEPDPPDEDLPSGSQQSFIGPDERPDVGGRLPDDGSGA